jgi:hypothetical protein
MEKLALIIPTKGRPELYQRFKDSWLQNGSDYSDIYPVIDADEYSIYGDQAFAIYTPKGYGLVDKLNHAANKLKNRYKYIGFAADDIVIKTPDFDKLIVDEFETSPGFKIMYFNDELNGEKIANHWVVRSNVIDAFGFFAPPQLKHMFIDNFITNIGRETNTIKYLDSVTWEHRHFVGGKANIDETYRLSNNSEVMGHDEKEYNKLISSEEYIKLKTLLINC